MPDLSLINISETEIFIKQLQEKHVKFNEKYEQTSNSVTQSCKEMKAAVEKYEQTSKSVRQSCEEMKKDVQNINNNFQDLLDFHVHLFSKLKKGQEKKITENSINPNNVENDIFNTLEILNIESEDENTGKDEKKSNQSETLGIVECTQFINKKNRTEASIAKNLNNSRTKSIIKTNSVNNKTNDIKSPLKLNKSQNSQEKSQNTGKLSLSKTHGDITIINGKISKQTKLVFQSVKKKQDISIIDNKNMRINNNTDANEFDSDQTIFDSAKLNKSPPSKLKNDENDIVKSMENNIDYFNSSPSQVSPKLLSIKSSKIVSNKSPTKLFKKSPRKNQSKRNDKTPLKIFSSKNNRQSPGYDSDTSTYYSVPQGISSNKNHQDSQESADLDETYCPRAEEILKKNLSNTGKRKINNVLFDTDKDINNKEINDKVDDTDVGNFCDWDIDVLLDKRPASSPPQKKKQLNNFDVVPEKKIKRPQFAYKGPVVRNKAERAKLTGWDCIKCEKYYENMGLSEEELQKRKNACSRHRAKHNPRYNTPEGFWNPNFSQPCSPSSEEETDD